MIELGGPAPPSLFSFVSPILTFICFILPLIRYGTIARECLSRTRQLLLECIVHEGQQFAFRDAHGPRRRQLGFSLHFRPCRPLLARSIAKPLCLKSIRWMLGGSWKVQRWYVAQKKEN